MDIYLVLRQMTIEDIHVGRTVYVNSGGIVIERAWIDDVYLTIPGGVKLDHFVLDHRSWNVDELLVVVA